MDDAPRRFPGERGSLQHRIAGVLAGCRRAFEAEFTLEELAAMEAQLRQAADYIASRRREIEFPWVLAEKPG